MAEPVATVLVTDAAVAGQLHDRLPGTLELDDRMGTVQVTALRGRLEPAGSPVARDYRAGDVAYRAESSSVVVFLTDGRAASGAGLTRIGHVDSGLEHLAGCARDCRVRLHAHEAGGS